VWFYDQSMTQQLMVGACLAAFAISDWSALTKTIRPRMRDNPECFL